MKKKITRYTALTLSVIIPLVVLYYYYAYYQADTLTEGKQCTLLYLTGFYCPGCGGQRSLHSLLHGQIFTALHYNFLFVIGLPFLIYLYYIVVQQYIVKSEKYQTKVIISSNFAWIFLAIIVIYTILRNINCYPFIYLAPM